MLYCVLRHGFSVQLLARGLRTDFALQSLIIAEEDARTEKGANITEQARTSEALENQRHNEDVAEDGAGRQYNSELDEHNEFLQ